MKCYRDEALEVRLLFVLSLRADQRQASMGPRTGWGPVAERGLPVCACVVAFGFPALYDAAKALGPAVCVYRCFAALY